MNGFRAEPGERRARVMSTQPPARSRPAEPTDARTARFLISTTSTAAVASGPCAPATAATIGSSRDCRSASSVEITLAWPCGALRANSPAACQARVGNGARRGNGSFSASKAAASVIVRERISLSSTARRAALAASGRRSGRLASGDCGRAISRACSPSVRLDGSWPK
jgi:hypothetical protein